MLPVLASDPKPLLDLFLEGRSPQTLRAYRSDIEAFAAFVGATPTDACGRLIAGSAGDANALVLAFRIEQQRRELRPSTINRRLAAVRSVVKLARMIGLVAWAVEVPSLPVQPYRDTRGPGRRGVRLLLDDISRRDTAKAKRDYSIVRLLYDLGLRRGEVASLDLEHLLIEDAALLVQRKGGTQRVRMTLPAKTILALQTWLAVRGTVPGPLFNSFDRARKGNRMTAEAIYGFLRWYGDLLHIRIRPHGLRHAAITEALEMTNGDVRAVAKFSGHRRIETVLFYDDARRDIGGDVARLVAEGV